MILIAYKNFRPFNEGEAWGLFRLAAIAEAVGWTILIVGIVFERYILPGNVVSIPLAGSIHGTLFLIYIAAAVILSPSQGWSLRRTLVAGIASVPPYGSLIFEQAEAHRRRQAQLSTHIFLQTYWHLLKVGELS